MKIANNLKPCSRVGINFTWFCNWACTTCFYRFDERFHKGEHFPIDQIYNEVISGIGNGANHALAIGFGEPSLYPLFNDFVSYCKDNNISSSMITNGVASIERYESYYKNGLNHLHISAHGIGKTLDLISERNASGERQKETLEWLRESNLPFRTNTTIQKINYKELPSIINYLIEYNAYHIVLLGFLPHYHWHNRLHDVAVHPAELRPYIEECASLLEKANKYFTIRYHPFCHLDSKYWKYVVNAKYVVFDPWEWMYGGDASNINSIIPISNNMSMAIGCSNPCQTCKMYLHCGGWNKTYADGFDGANLKPITEIPDEYKDSYEIFGGLHVMNPANLLKGYV